MDSQAEENLLIIDTDCGVDDAMAIMLALRFKKNTKVLAITCCAGNTSLDNVCNNVMCVLIVCKEKNIPVYRGTAGPLLYPFIDSSTNVHGEDGLGNVSGEYCTEDMKLQKIPAACALIELARKYPRKIYVAALGPLTNIALAQRLDPNFSSNLKELVFLGGNHRGLGNTTDAAEFNFLFDPEAAHVVVTEFTCPVTMVPWETVLQNGMNWGDFKEFWSVTRKYETDRALFLGKLFTFADHAFQKNNDKKFYDCDLLAVAAIVDPDCVASYEQFPITVECGGVYTRGQVVVKRRSQEGQKIKIITGFKNETLNQLREKNMQD